MIVKPETTDSDEARFKLFDAVSSFLSRAAGSEPLLEELAALDPDGLTPIAALQRLYELRREARDRLGIEG